MAQTQLQVDKAIEAALERSPEVNTHRDRITVRYDGDVAWLEGEVADIAVKRVATRVARVAAGRSTVADRLKVSTGEQRGDDALRQAVAAHLSGEPAFRDMRICDGPRGTDNPQQDWIGVEAAGGRVTLHGRVNSLSHRRLAELLAWWTAGTADVDNRVHVEPPEEDNDDEIRDAIRMAFDKEPTLDPEQIRVDCKDREVRLRGRVSSNENRRLAELDCYYIPGVHHVRNELEIP